MFAIIHLVAVLLLAFIQLISATNTSTTYLASKTLATTTTLFKQLSCSRSGQTFIADTAAPDGYVVSVPHLGSKTTWDSTPVCTSEHGPSDEILCVFTNTAYNNGQGLAVITTSKIGEIFAREHLLVSESVSTAQGKDDVPPVAVHIGASGKGLYSTQSVSAGKKIVNDRAVILTHPVFWDISWPEREELLRIAVSRLPVPTQRAILNFSSDADEIDFYLTEIVRTHAGFEFPIDAKLHTALFPLVGLINHSCGPNAHRRLDGDHFGIKVVAARGIDINEEITNSYFLDVDPKLHLQGFAERQQSILDSSFFACKCSRCMQGDEADEELSALIVRQATLDQNPDLLSPANFVNAALQLPRTYRRLQLDVLLHIPYRRISRAYAAFGDNENARAWMDRATRVLSLSDLLRRPGSPLGDTLRGPEESTTYE